MVGARLQIRRGSAPTTGPLPGSRGALDRRSDPTQYHSHSDNINSNNLHSFFNDSSLPLQFRRGSVPLELLRQSTYLATILC